jgi:hypothetical protein
MRRDQLEHAIRTACQIIERQEVIVVGSQAILGSFGEDPTRSAMRRPPPVVEKYTGVLGAADVFTPDVAFWLMESIRLNRGYGLQVHP